MLDTASNFMAKMDAIGWKYRDVRELEDGKVHVGCGFNGKAATVNFSVFFDQDGHSVSLRVLRFFPVPIDKRLQILEDINKTNKEYRWIKYYINDENDVNVQADAIINAENSGEIVVELIARTIRIIDNTYPTFMHTIWA